MNLWRQLRWRIVATHMAVVLVGVTALTLTVEVIISRIAPADIMPSLLTLAETGSMAALEQTTAELVDTFRNAVWRALLVAAGGAALMGLVASFALAWEILRPLRQIADTSQRLAAGHYHERVEVPSSDELAQMATSFNQMAQTLEEIEQQRVALIGNVAHELRTPLAGLAGYLEGVMDGVVANEPETFAHMYHEVRRMRRLVDDLQMLSRVEAGQMSLNVTRFDLVPLLARLVNQLQTQAEGQTVALVVNGEPYSVTGDPYSVGGGLYVEADPDRVTQVVLNLVSNALRYTEAGDRIEIEIGRADADHIFVSVCDTGLGIPGDALPYVFERFYRVDPSRARSSGGSGIGLTITRHLVWAMGGDISAHSDGPGQGSTFRFTLPAGKAKR
jgi:histidine kinase